jgi:transposase
MINQLQHLIFVIFPEFLQVLKIATKTARYLIKHYTTAEKICALGLESVNQIFKKVSRGKLGQNRAKQLYEAGKNSIGISEGQQSIVFEIEHLIDRIEAEDQFIDSLEKQMRLYLQQISYSQNILSIKGLGEVTVAGLIGEVADFKKFDTISEIMKLAGLDLYEISSGKHRGQRRISKRGRPLMRKLLLFAAINSVKSKGIMHEKYQQMLDRGMLKMKALVAISRKLLGLIFAIVRDNTKYLENYSDNYHYKLAA